jgi:2-keto-4-pentenoate hydratase
VNPINAKESRAEEVTGYKVGCTSRAIQAQLAVSEPIFGRLFATECHPSGVRLSSSRFANLAVEGELAIRLGRDLSGSDISEEACRAAIEYVFPVVELHHYILPETSARGPWLIASGGMHAGFVLAETEARSPALVQFARSLSVQVNEVVVGYLEDAASLTCPIESLRWLAGRLAQFGLQLRQGQVILTGSPLRLFPVAAAGRIVVEAPPLGVSRVEIDA